MWGFLSGDYTGMEEWVKQRSQQVQWPCSGKVLRFSGNTDDGRVSMRERGKS